ncbi:MAG: DnaJ C-terminal domain-containing protein [Thermoanaerobaculia bacterium]
MEFKDYYKILGVARDATQEEIQKAYRKLARKHHPDVSKDPGAESRFKEISEANEVLKDPEKRSKYDRFGAAWKQQGEGAGAPGAGFPGFEGFDFSQGGGNFAGGGSGFSNFFEMLFGQAGAPRGASWASWGHEGRGGWARPGANQEVKITLGLEEAYAGGLRELHLQSPSGESRRIKVNLPRGVRPGQTVRVPGKGEAGQSGGAAGDLLLRVEIAPHRRFRLEGKDLHTQLDVAPWEAALGGEAEIPTLDGKVRVRIPPGTSSGRRIRVRGKGFPAGKGTDGDLYAEVRIVVPDESSEREKELYRELGDASTFRPRPHEGAEN